MQIWTRSGGGAEHKFHHGVVTIGNFDGLHVGHQHLLAAADQFRGPKVVMTFDPHPVQVLYPERSLKRLMPRRDLHEQLPKYGVDLLIELAFDLSFARLSATEFLDQFLGPPLDPRAVVAGYDFGFGRDRSGNLNDLRTWCATRGAELKVVEPLELDGAIVSSRGLRALIEAGDVRRARKLLGRPFYLRGRVGTGAGRGATINFPTLNQIVENETQPGVGVYATRARLVGDRCARPSVTNVGVNPTFSGSELKVETHVIDADLNWRDRLVDVEFLERLRDERKFSGPEQLRAQIERDVAAAREVRE